MLTDSDLQQIMPRSPQAKRQLYLPFINRVMEIYEIDTPLRASAFLAHIAHESGELKYMEEIWGPTAQQKKYEPPSDVARRLGNTQRGDGFRYRGRGPIQVTGRANYKKYGDLLGVDLVGNPDLAATSQYAFSTAGLFWKLNGLNELADVQDFVSITKRINGSLNGLHERKRYYEIAKYTLGAEEPDDFALSPPPNKLDDQLEDDELGLDLNKGFRKDRDQLDDERTLGPDVMTPRAADATPLQRPETRWLKSYILDQDSDEPLHVGKSYLLDFGVDLKSSGDVSAVIPDASRLFSPGEELIELTVQLQSKDFDVVQPSQILMLPRTGPSRGKARFDVIPQHEGRGTLTATVHKKGNFVMQMEITYSIGTVTTEPPSTVAHGRTIAAATNLQPRELGMVIKPAPGGGYDCIVAGAVAKQVVLPITEIELGDAIKAARDGLISVITQRDGASRLVFQTSLDIDDASEKKALRTLARTGASLFQRIFFGPSAGNEVRQVGEWLRKRATSVNERLKLQIVAQRFPIPWGLLYVGEAGENAPLNWDLFLGMRHIIEQIPLQTNLIVDDSVIKSDSPSLAVSVNVNNGIDQQMKTDVVERQIRCWNNSAAAQGTRMQVTQRQTRADLLAALGGDANDQLMYLYCHAVTSGPGDAGGIYGSYLVLTNEERLTLGELNLDAPMTKPLQGNPLVFINACESAELSPSFYDGFLPYFIAKGSRGFMGTECKTPALFATEWALRFFPRFLAGESLGELFLELRREFCARHNNPLGLLYAVHCDGDTRIQPGLKI